MFINLIFIEINLRGNKVGKEVIIIVLGATLLPCDE
jgi:hypothetical protein